MCLNVQYALGILCNSKHFRTPFRLLMDSLSLFTHCHAKTADTCNLSVGKVYSGTQNKGICSMAFGRSLWKGYGEAGQMVTAVGKQREKDAWAQHALLVQPIQCFHSYSLFS